LIGLHERTIKRRWLAFNLCRLVIQVLILFFLLSLILSIVDSLGLGADGLIFLIIFVFGLDRLDWTVSRPLDSQTLAKAQEMNLLFQTKDLWFFHRKKLGLALGVLLLSGGLSYVFAWEVVNKQTAQLVSFVSFQAKLIVHRGANMEKTQFNLSKALPTSVKLVEDNILELQIKDSRDSIEIRLERPTGELFQSFLLQSKTDQRFKLNFTVSEPLYLVVDQRVAYFEVERVPIPEVEAELLTRLEDEVISDDQALLFYYRATSQTPLDRLEIVVETKQGQKRELVAAIMDDDLLEQDGNYEIVLDRFMSEDQEELTLFFEAVDKSRPVAMVGRSESITLKVVSAYGRYRMALDKLAEIRMQLEDLDQPYPDFSEVMKLTEKSPFFDSMDRMTLSRFVNSNPKDRLSLAADISDFLYEHEQMDQRERDRDFFIALRSLSRALENPKRLDPQPIRQRMGEFLTERSKVWQKRVEELGTNPEMWPNVAEELKSKLSVVDNQKDLNTLSQTYQQWLDQLESLEDKKQEEQEQQRQENMVSLLDELKELRRTQAEVSKKLDRADIHAEKIGQEWSMTRAEQMSNAKATSALEAKVRGMSPSASKRLQYAKKAMDSAVEKGEEQAFEEAESQADMAGRLLIEAQQKANQQSRQQRRRRISGNQYHGRNVDGGDIVIERQYQVDERYRQSILQDVNENMQGLDEPTQRFLKDYLRQVIK
jgi:hypothetical protein